MKVFSLHFSDRVMSCLFNSTVLAVVMELLTSSCIAFKWCCTVVSFFYKLLSLLVSFIATYCFRHICKKQISYSVSIIYNLDTDHACNTECFVIISVVTGNCPQPAPGPVLRLMQIRWVFKKLGAGGWSKELMCVGAQSHNAASVNATQSIATNSGTDSIGHHELQTTNWPNCSLLTVTKKKFGAPRRAGAPIFQICPTPLALATNPFPLDRPTAAFLSWR